MSSDQAQSSQDARTLPQDIASHNDNDLQSALDRDFVAESSSLIERESSADGNQI